MSGRNTGKRRKEKSIMPMAMKKRESGSVHASAHFLLPTLPSRAASPIFFAANSLANEGDGLRLTNNPPPPPGLNNRDIVGLVAGRSGAPSAPSRPAPPASSVMVIVTPPSPPADASLPCCCCFCCCCCNASQRVKASGEVEGRQFCCPILARRLFADNGNDPDRVELSSSANCCLTSVSRRNRFNE